MKAHRWIYQYMVGEIPEGWTIDHLCRNTSCVNPDHLEAVTHKENVLRGFGPTALNARKTHCKNGHLLDGDNLKVEDYGSRRCKLCQEEYFKKKLLRKREYKLNVQLGFSSAALWD